MSLDKTNSDTTSPSHVTIDSLPVRLGAQPLDISLRFLKTGISLCWGAFCDKTVVLSAVTTKQKVAAVLLRT